MNIFFGVTLFIWIIILVVGLIKPAPFKASRKKIALIFGLLIVVSFIGIGATSSSKPSSTTATDTSTQATSTPAPVAQPPAQTTQATIVAAQKELDKVMALAKTAGLITTYEFSDSATVVYADSVWYTQTVQFKKDFLAKVGTLKKQITGYQHFEVRDTYSNEKVAEITAFSGSLEVYK